MDIFDLLTMIGGLCLFIFGMNLMGAYLEKSAGSSLKTLLGKLTTGKLAGFLTGLGVTAVIQSSSATTVMVVGFVNSSIMTLSQAINVILGAKVGTTVTAWILSLTGIESTNIFMQLLKPSSFTPILALIGVILHMFCKSNKKKDIGVILLGFATLMFGMETMSGAVAGLKNDPGFASILTMFKNPVMGVLAGTVLTAIIQSSSASVGILQALSSTGQISLGMSIPIIMGQNIGTCVTALISSIGTNRNARRAALIHILFSVIGTVVLLIVFMIVSALINSAYLETEANVLSIAICHTVFNVLCTIMFIPFTKFFENLSKKLIPEPENETPEEEIRIDERLMATPPIAIERCRVLAGDMAKISIESFELALASLKEYSKDDADLVRSYEKKVDKYEDVLGSYLVKLSGHPLNDDDSHESAKILHLISDFERISDHAVNIIESSEELLEKGFSFTGKAKSELEVLVAAVKEIVEITMKAFEENDIELAGEVEPLEQVIDSLKEKLRARHIGRLQNGECTIEVGFVWTDLLNNLERISDHCSNIAGCVIEMSHVSLTLHGYLKDVRKNSEFYTERYEAYREKYSV